MSVGGGFTINENWMARLTTLGINRAAASLSIVVWPPTHAGNVVAEICVGTDTNELSVDFSAGIGVGFDKDDLGGESWVAGVSVALPLNIGELAASVAFRQSDKGGFLVDGLGLEWGWQF